jgi:hypothetical protein
MDVNPIIGVVLVLKVHKGAGIILVLNEPTTPQVTDTFLIAR